MQRDDQLAVRICLIEDLLAAAGALALGPVEGRRAHAERMLYEAHSADRYTKRFGRPHPRWGNGSLAARALAETGLHRPRPGFADIAIMAMAIDRFRSR